MMKMKSGAAIAATAAALFATGVMLAPVASANDAGVKCVGGNSCKGHSECKSAGNACKGQNSCKGKGWVHTKTEEECTKAGGKVGK